jgi:hypothetical protein
MQVVQVVWCSPLSVSDYYWPQDFHLAYDTTELYDLMRTVLSELSARPTLMGVFSHTLRVHNSILLVACYAIINYSSWRLTC